MKLLKPSWVHHDEKPIFSVDVHQECLKFATGGQGLDSGRIVIWNLLPVLSEKAELDSSVPKMLCSMDNHLACVNCVRWSQNGQMLASGSDDKLVMIWRKSKGSTGIFGTGGLHKTVENWKCVATLRGHSGDVLDLAWSPQDRWLASCSIDNTIIVWDCHAFPTMVVMLKGHTGLVKGVTWDPVGKFLASQSDDRSVKIWKTSDWSCSSTITEPFEECGGTTHILRLSWSPDGQYLVSAHAMNGGGPTAQIIDREGWKCDKDFVGHRKAVTCVRFHNSILKRAAAKTNKPQQYCCLAVGSRDRSLSVWMTALQRPLVVIHDLFHDSVLDLSWGAEKYLLMACSVDGTVACLQFSEAELGAPLSEEDKNSLYQRIYGKSALLENGSGNSTADILIENPELLVQNSTGFKPPLLVSNVDTNGTTTFNNNHNNNQIKSSQSLPAPAVESMQSSNEMHRNLNTVLPNASMNGVNFTTNTTALPNFGKQLETRASDGRRRITPVFIPLNDASNGVPLVDSLSTVPVATMPAPTAIISSIETPIESVKKPEKMIIDEEHLDARIMKTNCPHAINRETIGNYPINNMTPTTLPVKQNVESTAGTNIPVAAAHQASTTGPKFTITATSKCEFQKTALDHRVHVHNGFMQTTAGMLAKVTGFDMSRGCKLWETFVGSPIVNLNFCKKYVLLCSFDGSLRLLNMKTGSSVLPIMALNSATSHCSFSPSTNLVSVVGVCGALRIWDIENAINTLSVSCAEIIAKHGAVQQLSITDKAVPMLVFGNYYSYCFSQKMQSWLVMSTKDPILRHGLHTTIPKEMKNNFCDYPLTSVQASTLTFTGNCMGIDANTCKWQQAAKISFIENQIKLCSSVNSPIELKHWYAILGANLAAHGTEEQLRHVLDDLLGPSLSMESAVKASILSVTKHDLLSTVLSALKKDVKWQRLYMEYNELFENLKNSQNNTANIKRDIEIQSQQNHIIQKSTQHAQNAHTNSNNMNGL